MDFKEIENLNPDQILELYEDILETPERVGYQVCGPDEYGTGTYEYWCGGTGSNKSCTRIEICK